MRFLVVLCLCLFAVCVMAKRCDILFTPEECGYCFDDFDCNLHGDCLGVEQIGNVTLPGGCLCEYSHAGENCGHRRTNQLLILLLEIFVGGTGAPEFIMGRIGEGVGKILLFVFGLHTCGITWVGLEIWNLVYIVMAGVGSLKDSDGYRLDGWTIRDDHDIRLTVTYSNGTQETFFLKDY